LDTTIFVFFLIFRHIFPGLVDVTLFRQHADAMIDLFRSSTIHSSLTIKPKRLENNLRIQLLLFITLLGSNYLMAQPKDHPQPPGSFILYTNLNTAITAATNGDTIIFRRSYFAHFPDLCKQILHFVGAGHYPDSTLATGHLD
jgi:hypothetical protein